MAISLTRFAPSALVLAMAAYSGWPHLGGGAPTSSEADAGGPKAVLPELTAVLLTPTATASHSRDPFLDPESLRAAAIGKVSKMLKSWVSRYLTPPSPATAARPRNGSSGAKRAGDREATATSGANPDLGLVLRATFLQGRNGVAMINDRTYAPGQAITGLDNAEGPCVLREVHAYDVVLAYQGRTLTLRYPDASAPPRPRPAATAAGAGAPGADDPAALLESLFGGSEGLPLPVPRNPRRETRR